MLTDEQIREALRPLCDNLTTVNMLIETSMDEYRAIEAAVRSELEEDAERLNWISHQYLEDLAMGLVIDAPHDGEYYVSGDDGQTGYGPTLRAAIDAARAAKGGG